MPAPVVPSRRTGRTQLLFAASGIAGGVLWAALAVCAWLATAGTISYDAFNRLLTLPLLALTIGLVAVHRAIAPQTALARVGFGTLLLGFALLVAGNVTEFWGSLALGKVNAYAAYQAGVADHWIGSDVGWMLFGVGMLVAAVGGIVFALALRGVALAPPLRVFVGLLGFGIIAASALGLGPPLISVPVFVLYGTGWIALALETLPGRRPTSQPGG